MGSEMCIRDSSPFANVLQLTDCARSALAASGLSRILLLLADRTHTRLSAQQAAGLPTHAIQLQLDPNHSQVLRRLLAQPGQLHLTPTNTAQFSALLPGTLKTLFAGENLLLRSLATKGRVVMLVIADQQGAPISDIRLQAFSKTVQCIERALVTFTQRQA